MNAIMFVNALILIMFIKNLPNNRTFATSIFSFLLQTWESPGKLRVILLLCGLSLGLVAFRELENINSRTRGLSHSPEARSCANPNEADCTTVPAVARAFLKKVRLSKGLVRAPSSDLLDPGGRLLVVHLPADRVPGAVAGGVYEPLVLRGVGAVGHGQVDYKKSAARIEKI